MSDKTSKIVAGTVGFLTAGPMGIPMAVFVHDHLSEGELRGGLKWLAWSGIGVIVAPILLTTQALTASVILQALPGSQAVSVVTPTPPEGSLASFESGNFRYTNVQIYEYNLSSANPFSRNATVAGRLIEVRADVTNIGNESAGPSVTVGAIDENGRKFKEADMMIVPDRKGKTDFILPGETSMAVTIGIVDVSKNSKQFKVLMSSGWERETVVHTAK